MAKAQAKDFAFYCDVCELVFRVPEDQFGSAAKMFQVGCPACGRKAAVERHPGGGISIVHGQHIFICPGPLRKNPFAVVWVYVGGAIVLATILGVIAHFLGLVLCPVVFGTYLISIGIIGAIQLTMAGILTEKSFIRLMGIFYKGVPGLLGKRSPQGKVTAQPM